MGTKTKKSPAGKKSKSPVRNGKSVDFKVTNGIASGNATAKTEPNAMNSNGNGKAKSGLKHSPSARTLSRVERDKVVLWMKPWIVLPYAIMEILHLAAEGIHSLLQHKLVLFVISIISAIGAYGYITPGEHQALVIEAEKSLLWWGWWLLLGILSSIGFGSGLHTFLIYLGPHIAAVTLAAYECNSLDFPEPPYPESIVCPDVKSAAAITLWDIVAKVRVEALLWGAGTAIGELPPYFMARAARLSGDEPEDEEYKEFIEMMNTDRRGNSDEMSLVDRTKLMAEQFISKVGFPGILLFASIPNPLFDLAGITCGHFLVPFWSFFGATLIGKAIVKMHVQMLFVIIAFSEHHVEEVVNLLARIPNVGEYIRQPIKDFLAKQKVALHRTPGTHVNQESTLVQEAMGWIVTTMILFFLMSIVNSLAQQYHKRRFERSQRSL